MLISGRCHCGNIAFALAWKPEPLEIPARACSCSFCIMHGGVWTSCPTGSLKVTVQNPALVSKYTFGTKTAEFHICSKCGIVPVVTSRIEDRLYAVVSVKAFEGVEPSFVKPTAATFEGESEEMRLARRERNWIGDAEFVVGGFSKVIERQACKPDCKKVRNNRFSRKQSWLFPHAQSS